MIRLANVVLAGLRRSDGVRPVRGTRPAGVATTPRFGANLQPCYLCRFQWSIIIPSNTAVSERSQFGTVRHLVRAYCDSLESPAKPVWLVANPSPPGELPQGTEVLVQDCGAIGPLALRLSSSQLTVASLAFLSFQLLAPPELDVYSIAAWIDQSFEVHYTGDLAKPRRQRNLLFFHDESLPMPEPTVGPDGQLVTATQLGKGASLPLSHERRKLRPRPLTTVQAGVPFTYSRIVRVPDDDHVRPTTLDGTQSRIRAKHRLVFELKYRTPGSKREMHLEMSADLVVASCCCLSESLHLPTYARLAAVEDRKVKPFHMRCLCAASTSSLVEKEGEKLQAADASRVSRIRLPKLSGGEALGSGLGRRSREVVRGAEAGASRLGGLAV